MLEPHPIWPVTCARPDSRMCRSGMWSWGLGRLAIGSSACSSQMPLPSPPTCDRSWSSWGSCRKPPMMLCWRNSTKNFPGLAIPGLLLLPSAFACSGMDSNLTGDTIGYRDRVGRAGVGDADRALETPRLRGDVDRCFIAGVEVSLLACRAIQPYLIGWPVDGGLPIERRCPSIDKLKRCRAGPWAGDGQLRRVHAQGR